MSTKAFKLGDRVKDKITGFKGIVICVSEWINGCTRYGVQSEKLDKDGKTTEAIYFDEPQLERMKDGHLVLTSAAPNRGGPRANPVTVNSDPRR